MNIQKQRKGEVLVLHLSGQLDNAASQKFSTIIAEYMRDGEKYLLLNFAQVNYLSSSGLRLLLEAAQTIDSRGGKLLLCSLAPSLMQAIELVGFHKILHIYPTEHEALKDF